MPETAQLVRNTTYVPGVFNFYLYLRDRSMPMPRFFFKKNFSDFTHIYHILPRRLRRSALKNFVLTGILSVTELLSILSVSALAMSIAAPEKLFALKPVVLLFQRVPCLEHLSADQRLLALAVSCGAVSFIAAKNALMAAVTLRARRLEAEVAVFAAETIFKHYLYSPYTAHLAGNSQNILQALSWRVQLASLFGTSIMLYVHGIIVLILFITLLFVTPGMVLLLVAVIAALMLGIYGSLRKKLDRVGKNVAQCSRQENACFINAIRGIRETLMYSQQEAFFSAYREASRNALADRVFGAAAPSMPTWMLETAGFMLIPLIFCLMYFGMNASMARITGVLTMLMLVFWRVLPILNKVLAALVTVRTLRPTALDCLERVEEALASPAPVPPEPDPDFVLRQGISLSRVSFRYPKTENSCLSAIDCRIPSGTRLGVIGQSGAGKSTLALILSGLVRPTGGRMLADGRELTPEALAAYRRRVGYVPQSPYLMPGTLAENVAFSQWGKPWDEERVRSACRMAKLDVAETRGLDLSIGENGAGLSGGQIQRLAIARALYVNPSVLILDEATSALDSGVESAIMDTIFSLPLSITTVIIAHRLSTVERCDLLLWLEEGRLAASGPPHELLPRYQAQVNRTWGHG